MYKEQSSATHIKDHQGATGVYGQFRYQQCFESFRCSCWFEAWVGLKTQNLNNVGILRANCILNEISRNLRISIPAAMNIAQFLPFSRNCSGHYLWALQEGWVGRSQSAHWRRSLVGGDLTQNFGRRLVRARLDANARVLFVESDCIVNQLCHCRLYNTS